MHANTNSGTMKTKTLFGFWGFWIFTIIFLFSTEGVLSQQVIKLKNGKKFMANIKSQSNDTLVYQLLSKPKITQWVLMNEVDNIKTLQTGRKINLVDTIPDKKREELYHQNRELRNIGLGFVIGGAVVTGLGLVLFIPAASEDFKLFSKSAEWAHDQMVSGAIITAIGAAGLLTGTILATVGGTKMKKYSMKHGISLDFKFTPGQKGLSLVYRF
jgi:hypothetical protein